MYMNACAGNETYSGSTATETVGVVGESTKLLIAFTPDPTTVGVSTPFYVTLNSGGPGYPAIDGEDIILNFGDGTGNFTSSTNSNGIATFMHTYATLGTYSAIGIFAGAPSLNTSSLLFLPYELRMFSLDSGICSIDAKDLRVCKHWYTSA